MNSGFGKRFRRCVLHIGTEKTGTSTIQRFLSRNRQQLAQDGIVYPAATGRSGGSQWGFVACSQEKPWGSDVGAAFGIHSAEDREQYREQLRRSLRSEFDAVPAADTLLISSEHLHSRLQNEQGIARLREFLDLWVEEYEIVVYFRRQDRVAVSYYSTKIKAGNPEPVLFHGAPKGQLPYYFDYDRIYDNWSAVFGPESIRARLFSPREWVSGDLVQDFCILCGLSVDKKHFPKPENESLSQAGVDFLLELNRRMPNMVDGKRNPRRDALANRVSELCKGKNWPASRADAKAFFERFADSNARLKEKAFPGRSEPLFDDDFSDYPEKLDVSERRYEDAVEIAIKLWESKCL